MIELITTVKKYCGTGLGNLCLALMCFIIVVVSHKLSILALKRQPQKLLIYDAIHLNEKHSGFFSVFEAVFNHVRKIVQWKSTILEFSLITEGSAEKAFNFLMPVW
jgi:hypothetical protein